MTTKRRIADAEFDPDLAILTRAGAHVPLRARSFALLAHLVRNDGRVISKQELLDAVWPEVIVTEDSLTQAIADLRRALGPSAIRTVPRRGYVLEPAIGEPSAITAPVIVVLPARLQSERASDGLLSDGLMEELTHGLGRYGLLRVIARHSAFQFRPETIPPEQAAARLGAAYFVTGSARRISDQLWLTLSLCATGSATELWSERSLLDAQNLESLLASLPHRIAARLDLDVQRKVAASTGQRRDLEAFELLVTAIAAVRQYGPAVNERARDCLQAAIARDPGLALAHSYLGLTTLVLADYDAAPPAAQAQALAHARRGLALAPDDARCHLILGILHLFMRERATAELCLQRALVLNPSDADILAFSGYALGLRGRFDEGLELLYRAEVLNPLHPPWYHMDIAILLQLDGQHQAALDRFRCLPDLRPFTLTRMAACQAGLGHMDEAYQTLAQAAIRHPGWDAVAQARNWQEPEREADRQTFIRLVEAAAGLPE